MASWRSLRTLLGYIPARDFDLGVGVGAGAGLAAGEEELATGVGAGLGIGGGFATGGAETTRCSDDSTSEFTEFGSWTWVGDTFGSVFEVASFIRSIRRRVVIVDPRIYRVNAFIL